MDVSYINISNFYTGQTNELRFVTVPITVTKNNFLLAIVIACDVGLTPTIPSDWREISKLENSISTGTTFIFTHQPTGTTINPTWEISGLSTNLNAGYIMMFSGCTTNQNKIINYEQSQRNDTGESGGVIQSTINNSMAVRLNGLFRDRTISSWDSSPSLSWTEAAQGAKTNGLYQVTLGVSYHNKIDTSNYDLSFTVTTTIPPNNTHNISLTPKSGNINLMINSI